MNSFLLTRIHSFVLIACSLVGLAGYYLQTQIFQITALIPFTVGMALLFIANSGLPEKKKMSLLLLITAIFGIIFLRMAIKFSIQDFQPLRKRIYFPLMALSSVLTTFYLFHDFVTVKKK